MRPSLCRSCDAEIFWLEHAGTGKRAPIDAMPDPKGNIVISLGDGKYRMAGEVDRLDEKHLNHFSTCPQAKDWKR